MGSSNSRLSTLGSLDWKKSEKIIDNYVKFLSKTLYLAKTKFSAVCLWRYDSGPWFGHMVFLSVMNELVWNNNPPFYCFDINYKYSL